MNMRSETVVAKSKLEAQHECPWAQFIIEIQNRDDPSNIYLCFSHKKLFVDYLDSRVKKSSYGEERQKKKA